ncbi:hypothetical protein CLOM_g16596 [Closterium sp. NIES-68]|nr:hypothetical protein CLOM_g16596 [Closterium sp. NIES-68]
MKRVTWEEKLRRLEEGEATPLRRSARISQPPERFSPGHIARMHDHLVSECDPALYHFVRDEERISLFLYVDDLLLLCSSKALLDRVKDFLSSRFRMKDLGEVKYYLGMQIERDESGILIHQESYLLAEQEAARGSTLYH